MIKSGEKLVTLSFKRKITGKAEIREKVSLKHSKCQSLGFISDNYGMKEDITVVGTSLQRELRQ